MAKVGKNSHQTWFAQGDWDDEWDRSLNEHPEVVLNADLVDFGFNYLGAWNEATEYAVFDAVEYEGALYVSIKTPNKGQNPTVAESAYWLAPGAQGPPGPEGPEGPAFTLGEESVETKHLKALAVTEAKLAAEAVGNGKIAAGAVTAAKIGTNAVEEAKIKEAAVSASKIAVGAVTETKLGAEAVTAGKIATGAVTEGKLGSEAVGTTKIANLAVTEGKLANEAVAAGKLKSEAVETAKIKNLAVTEGKLAAEAVTLSKIAVNSVRETFARGVAGKVDILFGTYGSEGNTISGGSGIEVSKTGVGTYTITYEEFKEAPAVTLTTNTSNTFFQVTESGKTTTKIASKTVTTTPAAANAGFHLQIMGKRP